MLATVARRDSILPTKCLSIEEIEQFSPNPGNGVDETELKRAEAMATLMGGGEDNLVHANPNLTWSFPASDAMAGKPKPLPAGLINKTRPARGHSRSHSTFVTPSTPVQAGRNHKRTSSRFSFLFPMGPKTPEVSSGSNDEFLDLDINNALFPNGPADPFSPSSFKNLLMNAESVLAKFKAAYKARTIAVQELIKEKEAQDEKLEEAETRASHLKAQLDDLGNKLTQQDHDIMDLNNQLAHERKMRAELEEEKKSQHLDVDHKACGRSLVSRGSRSSLDSSYNEDNDSFFSHPHTRTSSTGTSITIPEVSSPQDADTKSISSKSVLSMSTSMSRPTLTKINTQPSRPSSMFSKIHSLSSPLASPALSRNCPNCRGESSTMAWDTVGLLRAENQGLKDRLSHLEDGLEDALNLAIGSWRG